MIDFKNVERLVDWYNEHAKKNILDVDALLDEVVKTRGETGCCSYELSSYYSKDGNPHCYEYEYEIVWNSELDQAESETYIF